MSGSEYPHEEPLPENVKLHPGRRYMELPVSDILRVTYQADLQDIVVFGRQKDGREFFSSSMVDVSDAVYLLQRGVHLLNTIADELQMELQQKED